MSETRQPCVLFERVSPHVALVTLNRPEARNAVNGQLARELGAIVEQVEADDAIWAAVLTGAGGAAFCAGADLKAVAAAGTDQLRTERGGFAGFVFAPREKVWIAAVDGFALAGGLELALACDMIVAGEGASFGLPEVTRGLVAGAGGIFRLPQRIPRAVALELIATGGRIDAARAHALGLANRLVAAGTARQEALALAELICGNAPVAVRESLRVARVAGEKGEAELLGLAEVARQRVMVTEDFREGPKAFAEKRAPVWKGK